jgi:uncharacterized protein (TIGR00375 family)
MIWRVAKWSDFTLVSFSDSHSFWPWRIGREATIFELKEPSYESLIKAIRTREGLVETIEVNPSYGKYHYDGHRDCGVSLSPQETKKSGSICPVCHRPLTVGVLHRIEELADRPEGFIPKNARPFHSLLPLSEIISSVIKSNPASTKVWEEYNNLINAFGSELNVLLEVDEERMKRAVNEKIADMIMKVRNGKINVKPGYDGVYGELETGEQPRKRRMTKKESEKTPQKTLGDF